MMLQRKEPRQERHGREDLSLRVGPQRLTRRDSIGPERHRPGSEQPPDLALPRNELQGDIAQYLVLPWTSIERRPRDDRWIQAREQKTIGREEWRDRQHAGQSSERDLRQQPASGPQQPTEPVEPETDEGQGASQQQGQDGPECGELAIHGRKLLHCRRGTGADAISWLNCRATLSTGSVDRFPIRSRASSEASLGQPSTDT